MAKEKPWLWEQSLDDLLKTHGNDESPNDTEPTRLARIDYYLAYWIGKARSKKSAQVLGPILRKRLLQLFEKHRKTIEQLQRIRLEEEKVKGSAEEDD